MTTSPTQRTLAWCRRQSWPAQVVERWIPQARKRVDLFGCIDIVALDGEPGVLGIQATTGANLASRVTKAREQEHFAAWLDAGNRFVVIGWRALKRGGRRVWEPRIVEVKGDVHLRNVLGRPVAGIRER